MLEHETYIFGTGQEQPSIEPLLTYRSVKVVGAAQILAVAPTEDPSITALECKHFLENFQVLVDDAWMSKHSPSRGWYLVQYDGGYLSASPEGAFEDGYRLDHNALGATTVDPRPGCS